MTSRGAAVVPLVLLIAASTSAARASQTDWHTQLQAYVGSIGGSPEDVNAWLAVTPGATDGWDGPGIDKPKPAEPFGAYVYTWFERPAWGIGPVARDVRSEIVESASKVWGSAPTDTFKVKLDLAQEPSGLLDPCGSGVEYPVASPVCLTWQIGPHGFPPPADYRFTLRYEGGISPKPAGTAPAGLAVPALDQTWDMNTVGDIVLPLWRHQFQPFNESCDDLAMPDVAKFKIIVENPPDATPAVCDISFVPDAPTSGESVSFDGNVTGGVPPYSYAWDFGDGSTAAEASPSHAYAAGGTFTVALTATDSQGAVGQCSAGVEVGAPPACGITHDPASPTTDDVVVFDANAADPDGMVIAVDWDFGDGETATGDPAAHQYAMPGTYTATATVCDDDGLCVTCSAEVVVGAGANIPPVCDVTYEPGDPAPGAEVAFSANAYDPNPWGIVVSYQWDYGDGATGSGEPATHVYADSGSYTVCVTVTDDQGGQTACCTLVTVRLPRECAVAIDRTHCKMPAAGHVGQCKTGQIGARNESATEPCTVALRVTDQGGSVVFDTVETIEPNSRARVRFAHCFAPDEVGKCLWMWEVWPVDCDDLTPWNNTCHRRVIVHP